MIMTTNEERAASPGLVLFLGRIVRHALVLGGIVCCLLSLSLVKAYGQLPSPSSYLFVEVKDAAGRAVPDATITVSDPEEKEITTQVFQSEGVYHLRFPIRSDHHYNVLISKPGYLQSEHVFFYAPDYERLFENIPNAKFQSPVIVLRNIPSTAAELRMAEAEEQKNKFLLAAKRGDGPRLRMLLKAGAGVNTVDAEGAPAIAWAAFSGEVEAIIALLSAGADVRNENSPAHKALLIYLAEGLRRALKTRNAGLDNANRSSKLAQHDDVVLKFIKAGAGIDSHDISRETVLNAALRQVPNSLSPRIIKALIKAGANVNFADEYRRVTPLMVGVQTGSLETVKMLLAAGASINAKDRGGGTALMRAQISSKYPGYNPAIVKELLAAGASVEAADEYGNTALILAAQADLSESVEMLLAAGARVDAKEKRGETALILAFNSQYYAKENSGIHPSSATVKALLAAGANVHDVSVSGQAPLFLAARANSLEAVMLLLQAGADVNAKDKKGQTAIMFDSLWGYRPNLEIVRALLAAGADVNAVDQGGRTPLMFASQDAQVELVKLLVAAGAKVNIRNRAGQTALTHAVKGHNEAKIETVKALLAGGADANITDNQGISPLAFAKANGDQEVIKLLTGFTKP
jgi:uncharacterized protein